MDHMIHILLSIQKKRNTASLSVVFSCGANLAFLKGSIIVLEFSRKIDARTLEKPYPLGDECAITSLYSIKYASLRPYGEFQNIVLISIS